MTTLTTVHYETIIGLEVHAQLLTKSKMFCGCSVAYQDAPPNTHVCPVCLGMPGVLPVINRQAVEYTIMTALALHCQIAEHSKFDRKNYPYPDLMKGYQISQYDLPLSSKGWLDIEVEGQAKRVGITRVHLEEDTARLLHRVASTGETYSLVDVNRAGTPLMEIVGEPDLRSPEEARAYLVKLRSILRYLGVSTGNMEEGSFRCDANVSVRPREQKTLSTKVEIKNMNSFRAVYRALQYEVQRQIGVMESGEKLAQETRGWVEEKGVTVSQRSKEYAHDYRYFPEPDLPPLRIDRAWVDGIRARLPELPDARRQRFIDSYRLPPYDASLLTADKALADYFEACVRLSGGDKAKAKNIGNWLLGDFARLLNAGNAEIGQSRISPQQLVDLLALLEKGTVSGPAAKSIFETIYATGKDPQAIVQEQGLSQISGTDALAPLVEQAIAANPKAVADYKAGKQEAVKFLVGQVMKLSRGRANPSQVTELLKQQLPPSGA